MIKKLTNRKERKTQMRRLIISLMLVLFLASVTFGAKLTQKQLAFIDEFGDPVNMGTSVSLYIYNVGTTTETSCYLDRGGNTAVTQPITDNSTNTCFTDYTKGKMTFWSKPASYKITVTDGTYTRTLDNLTGSDTRMMWPSFLTAMSSYNLGESEDLDFTYGAWVVDGDTAGRLDFTPDAADGVLAFGASTGALQGDVYTYASSTEFMYFDQSGAELNFTHIDVIVDDDSTLYLGDGKDIACKFDNANDDLDITGDGSEIAIGATGAGLDVYIWGQTGNFVFFDEDNDRTFFEDWDLRINEGSLIEFADTGDAVDWTVKCSTAERLQFLPTETTDDQVFHIGDADHTADFVIYSKTAGETFTWDAGADSLTVVGDLALFTVTGTTVPFRVDATGTVASGNAIELETTSGPIQILADGASTGDITIDAEDTITLVSTDNGAAGIYLHANGGTAETIKIHSDQGTSVTEGAESINILSDAGGVGIRSTANLANAVNITADSGTTTSISIFNDTGTSTTENAASIDIWSDVGGIEIQSDADLADSIVLRVDGGTTSAMMLHNDQGTAADSIELISDVGGIDITAEDTATGDILIDANDKLTLLSASIAAQGIYIHTDGGTSETLQLHSDQGTGATSIYLLSDVGGITATASAGAIVLNATGATAGDYTATIGDEYILDVTGGIAVGSAEEAADAIGLTASGTAGGITMVAGTAGIYCSGDILKGYTMEVENVIAAKSVGATESGEVFTVQGGESGGTAADIVLTLPTAVAGYIYHVIDANETQGADVTITAASGDKIDDGSAAASIVHDTDADNFASVTLVAIDATNWVTLTSTGTWAAE